MMKIFQIYPLFSIWVRGSLHKLTVSWGRQSETNLVFEFERLKFWHCAWIQSLFRSLLMLDIGIIHILDIVNHMWMLSPSPSSSPCSPAKVYLIKSRPEYWRTDGFLYDGRKLGQTSLLSSQLSHQQPTSFKTIVDAAALLPPAPSPPLAHKQTQLGVPNWPKVWILVFEFNHWFLYVRWATRTIFSIIDPFLTPISSFILHCNYKRKTWQKWDLVIAFDWWVLLTQGPLIWTAFCKFFSGIPEKNVPIYCIWD